MMVPAGAMILTLSFLCKKENADHNSIFICLSREEEEEDTNVIVEKMKSLLSVVLLFVPTMVSAFSTTTSTSSSSLAVSQLFLRKKPMMIQPPTRTIATRSNSHQQKYHRQPSPRTTTTTTQLQATTSSSSVASAWISMSLLALQFATQPMLTRKFTPKSINRNAVVIGQEAFKFVLAGLLLLYGSPSSSSDISSLLSSWTIQGWAAVAVGPALLYSLQGLLKLVAYQNLDGFTFNVLNQTKTLASALCCFLLMGQKQTKLQIVALLLLFASACIMEGIVKLPQCWGKKTTAAATSHMNDVNTNNNNDNDDAIAAAAATTAVATASTEQRTKGVVAVILASLVSGLAGALSQKSLQGYGGGRNSYLFTMELSVASSLFLVLNGILSSFTSKKKQQQETTKQQVDKTTNDATTTFSWTILIPMMTNAVGGILVGLVTKQVGTVQKGFALIFGLWLSGLLQWKVSLEQIVGAALASVSLWMHMTFR